MEGEEQPDLLSPASDIRLMQFLLAELHDDLLGKIARFHQLADLSGALGSSGTMIYGGETSYAAWTEARTSFIHGNYVATVLLCQGLAEHLMAAFLSVGLNATRLPDRISFHDTLSRCLDMHLISDDDVNDLKRLMALRNPLSHYRNIDDPTNLSRRAMDSRLPVEDHLRADASFAIGMAIRLLALPAFRLGQ